MGYINIPGVTYDTLHVTKDIATGCRVQQTALQWQVVCETTPPHLKKPHMCVRRVDWSQCAATSTCCARYKLPSRVYVSELLLVVLLEKRRPSKRERKKKKLISARGNVVPLVTGAEKKKQKSVLQCAAATSCVWKILFRWQLESVSMTIQICK